jgi:hypothetical protein
MNEQRESVEALPREREAAGPRYLREAIGVGGLHKHPGPRRPLKGREQHRDRPPEAVVVELEVGGRDPDGGIGEGDAARSSVVGVEWPHARAPERARELTVLTAETATSGGALSRNAPSNR